ncbi:MAG: hypothetical protein WB930_12360 [Syntrophobacteraceae bacterium]
MKKKQIIATVAVSAAIVLSGVTMKAGVDNKAPTLGKVASKVGKIVPVNMLLGSAKFSTTKAFADECCGPYAQCKICNY